MGKGSREGSYVDERTAPTVGQAVDHWLADKNGKVKPSTLKGYKVVVNGAIRGPLLIGTRQERADYTESGIAPKGARFIKLLGHVKLTGRDHRDDPHLAPHHRRAVRHLHGEPGEEPPQVDPGARRGGLLGPRAVDADRAVSRPAQAEEGDPNDGAHRQTHRRAKDDLGARRLLRLPLPCRHATVRATWACCGARSTLTTISFAFAASRSAMAR